MSQLTSPQSPFSFPGAMRLLKRVAEISDPVQHQNALNKMHRMQQVHDALSGNPIDLPVNEDFVHAVRQLSTSAQAILRGFYIDRKSVHDICAECGVTPDDVKAAKDSARELFRQVAEQGKKAAVHVVAAAATSIFAA